MQPYNKTLRFLYDLQLFGIKMGLENIKVILQYLGNPEDHFPSIHIAGTNGKGSTAAMIASILTASGYRTGLYTSPHLVDFSERIRIDSKKISHDEIIHYTKHLQPVIEKQRATFFEATTAIAFQYFVDRKVDIAVIETGLGGRWDATNVINPLLSIITTIGIEHTEHLGKSYSSIAFEKGGIIKPFIPCITGATNRYAINQLKAIAQSNKSKFIQSGKVSSCTIINNSIDGLRVNLVISNHRYNNLFVSLPGEHQGDNLQLAMIAIDYLKELEGYTKIRTKGIICGLSSVQRYSGLRGRLDVLRKSPLLIADVAHNPDAVKQLVRALRSIFSDKFVVVFGVMNDKNYSEMIDCFKPIIRTAVTVTPAISRALECDRLLGEFHSRSMAAISGKSVENGLKEALSEVRDGEPILITGSHYVVGEALNFLKIST